jgi:hypothetical protein
MSRAAILALVLAAAIAVAVGGSLWANRAGICLSTRHRLTDQEVLDRATIFAMQLREASIRRRIEDRELSPSSPVARYDDPARFAADHPDCCAILPFEPLREEEQPPTWARNLGYFRAYVRVQYTVRPVEAVERTALIVDNCGDVDLDFY